MSDLIDFFELFYLVVEVKVTLWRNNHSSNQQRNRWQKLGFQGVSWNLLKIQRTMRRIINLYIRCPLLNYTSAPTLLSLSLHEIFLIQFNPKQSMDRQERR